MPGSCVWSWVGSGEAVGSSEAFVDGEVVTVGVLFSVPPPPFPPALLRANATPATTATTASAANSHILPRPPLPPPCDPYEPPWP